MSEETMIRFKNVTKAYKLYKNDKQKLFGSFIKKYKPKEKIAIDNASFTIKKGESVAFLGRNGAGKSTILKMIAGVCFPTKGEIEVNGIVSALLELTTGFDSESTGIENIYFKGHILGMKKQEIKALEQSIIDFAELGEYIDQPVRTYSSGMKARLGFSICVNIYPEILIIDEALSVGDVEFKEKCVQKMKEIINSDDVTVLFVTHGVSTAREFCKRGIVLKEGKIMFDGGINEAIENYNSSIKRNRGKKKDD